jgi:hypothetical protein
MCHRSRVAHFVIDVDDLDQGVAFWSAALDAKKNSQRGQQPGLPQTPTPRF